MTQLLNEYLVASDFSSMQMAGAARVGSSWNESSAAEASEDGSVQLNFRGARLGQVLDYLSAVGFIVSAKANVEVGESMDVWSDRPVPKEEALDLVKQALNEKGYSAFRNGRKVTVIRTEDAKKSYIPIQALCRAQAG